MGTRGAKVGTRGAKVGTRGAGVGTRGLEGRGAGVVTIQEMRETDAGTMGWGRSDDGFSRPSVLKNSRSLGNNVHTLESGVSLLPLAYSVSAIEAPKSSTVEP